MSKEYEFDIQWSGKITEEHLTLENFMKANPHLGKEEAMNLMLSPFTDGLTIISKLITKGEKLE